MVTEDTQFPSSPTLESEPLSNEGSPSSIGKHSDLDAENVAMPVGIPSAPAPTTAATSTQIEGSAGAALPRHTNVSSTDIFYSTLIHSI